MLKRGALAVVLVGAAFGALFAGRIPLLLFLLLVSVLAAGELFRMSRSRGIQPAPLLGLAGIVALLVVAHERGERAPTIFPLVIAAVVGAAFAVMLGRRSRTDITRAVASTMMPVIVVGLLGAYVIVQRGARGGFRAVLGFWLMAVAGEMGVLVAIAIRTRRGSHPGIAWEPFAGALVASLIAGVIAATAIRPPFNWTRALVLAVLVAASTAVAERMWDIVQRDLPRVEPAVRRTGSGMLRGIDGFLLAAPVFFYAFRVLAR